MPSPFEPVSSTAKLITINIQRASVARPPFQKDIKGNEITDDRGNPILKKFNKLNIQTSRDPNPTQEVLSEGLIEISKGIDEVGLEDLIEIIEGLPPYFEGLDGLKRSASKLVKFQRIMGPTLANASNTALVGGAILQNRLTFAEAREASEIVREFDQAIRPFF